MTNALKRHVYLYCVLSTFSFLAGFLLYDLLDLGIATDKLLFPCTVLWMTSALLAFKAGDIWSGWETDTREDADGRRPGINPYPLIFSIVAILMMLLVVLLFFFIIIRHRPTVNETCVLAFGLVAAEICICLNRLSSRLE